MEILENTDNNNAIEKKFVDSQVTLNNRKVLNVTGVEKVYETNETKIQLKVAGSNMLISGQTLNITRLDVEAGVVQVEGTINEIKYTSIAERGNLFKKLFK